MNVACPVVLASRHPTELELINSYLRPRITSGDSGKSCEFIHHADVYTADPTTLAKKFLPAVPIDGDKAWYFFSPVRTKSLRGQRKARTVESGAGCWHSEAGMKPVLDGDGRRVGHRQFFSFITKDDGKRNRTGWLMVELGLDRQREENMPSELVLCKIYFTPRVTTAPIPDVIADTGDKRKNIDDESPDEAPPVRRCCHDLPQATASSNVVTEEQEITSPAPDSPSTPTSSASPSSSPSSSPPSSTSYPSPTSSMSPPTPPPSSVLPSALEQPVFSSSVAAQDEAVTVPAESSSPYFILPSLDYSRQEVYVICRGDCSLTHQISRGDCRVTIAICKGDCHVT